MLVILQNKTLRMTIYEPSVTLTDYGLTIECVYFTYLLMKQRGTVTRLYRWFVMFFCALGLASFIGGTSHGFFYDESSALYTLVWNSTLISLGAVGVAAYMIASILVAGEINSKRVGFYIVAAYIIYCSVIILVNNEFYVAIAFYLPASAAMLLALVWVFFKIRRWFVFFGISGMLITFIASAIQQLGISIHPIWLDHNVIYHLLMAIAIMLLFYTAQGFLKEQNLKQH
jgi:hypothetical protein